MAKENVIVIYVRKGQMNISIINRIGEASRLIRNNGFKFTEEDVTHDFAKQKELHQTPNAANEYPLFQYHKDKENIYHIGNLMSLKAFLSSPPPSVLSLHDSEVEVQDIIDLLSDNESPVNTSHNNDEKKEESEEERARKEEEEEKEPALGLISQSLQTVEGVVKYSTSWITSWFYTPPTVTPLTDTSSPSSSPSIEAPSNSIGAEVQSSNDNNNNNNNNNNENPSQLDENKDEIKEFKVVQTNWYWRQQNRVLRFDLKNKIMYRYDPLDLTIRAIHPFAMLKDITCYNSQYFFQLTFYKAENDPTLVYEYYTTSSSDYPLVLSLLTNHSSLSPNVLP